MKTVLATIGVAALLAAMFSTAAAETARSPASELRHQAKEPWGS